MDVNLETLSNNFFKKIIHCDNITEIIDIKEPTTQWNRQIDPRTNYPFYWNSDTQESLWDEPKDYKDYLKNMKEYLDELKSTYDSKFDKSEKDNVQQVQSLIGYSDSEDDENELKSTSDNIDKPENLNAEEQEAAIENLKVDWFQKQYHEAEEYLINLIKEKSDDLKYRIESLTKYNLCNESLKHLIIKNETRLEDWNEGFISRERLINKLNAFLTELSYVESSLETDQWSIVYDRETKANKCQNKENGQCTFDMSVLIFNTEEGEIVESLDSSMPNQEPLDDTSDLANDLNDYVCKELHSSLDISDFVDKSDKDEDVDEDS